MFEGLIELATPIVLNGRVQPMKLPSECQKNMTNEPFIAIGNGLINFDIDKMVRPLLLKHAHFNAMSYEDCVDTARYDGDPSSILCILPRTNGLVHMGDSGIDSIQSSILIICNALFYDICHNHLFQ